MKKALTFRDVFKFPLCVDDYAYDMVFDNNNVHVIDMCIHDMATSKTIVDILNGDCKGKMTGKLSYGDCQVYLNDKYFIRLRGWGHLIGCGGLNLSAEEAAEIQDEFGNWICEKLQE